jgi:hypothetical protein
MPLTTAEQVRLRIQDPAKPFDMTVLSDGTGVRYNVPYLNIVSGTAYVAPGGTAWSATGATFNVSGFVEFADRVSANSAVRFVGVYSVFSDAEIGHFTGFGSVPAAAMEAVRTLMFDGLKRARWMSPDGAQYDDVAAQAHLERMYSALKDELADENLGAGALTSWSLEQENY